VNPTPTSPQDPPRPSGPSPGTADGRGDVVPIRDEEDAPQEGTVLESVGGVYHVRLDRGTAVEAFLRGRLKRDSRTGDRVVAGDRVSVSALPGEPGFTVEAVLPRRNALVRAAPGGHRAKIVAANLDRCLVVLSAVDPPFQQEIADRFLVLAESCHIPPVLVVNKADLDGAAEVTREATALYAGIDYPVLETSALSGKGLDALRDVLSTGISAVVGPSGVGKSSLLNALDPGLELRTAPVSRRGRRGRHTTVGARLLPVGAHGWVADTPGFSDCDLWRVDPAEVAEAFPEFAEPGETCRFRGCSHLHEPDCGVQEAVADGTIPEARYRSYRVIRTEGE